jgi:hypothetical protein
MRVGNKRTWCLFLLAFSTIAIIWLVIIYFSGYDTTRSAFDRIELGMTLQQVDDVIGYCPQLMDYGSLNMTAFWRSPTGEHIIVDFNRGSGATTKRFVESETPLYERVWENLRESFTGEFRRQHPVSDVWDPWRIRPDDEYDLSDW